MSGFGKRQHDTTAPKQIHLNITDTIIKEKSKRVRARRIFSVMAAIVVFFTTYALVLPALTVAAQPYCGLAEHQHDDSCYDGQLVCGKEEHVHTLECFSNPRADVETADVWEATLPAEDELTGVPAEDLVAVAKSQIGYSESEENYIVDENGKTKIGYSRYGEWSEEPYADWSMDFVAFCLHYSGIEIPVDTTDQEKWMDALDEAGLLKDVSEEDLAVGDIVFLESEEDGSRDVPHMGIVSFAGTKEIVLIEGDRSKGRLTDGVMEQAYKQTSDKIIAAAGLPEDAETVEVERSSTAEADTDADEVPADDPSGDEAENAAEGGVSESSLSYTGDGYVITASFTEDAGLAPGTELVVSEIHEDGKTAEQKEFQKYYEQAEDVISDDIASARFFDITFEYEGEAVEPTGDVNVTITLDQPADGMATAIHLPEGKDAEVMDASTEGNDISFTASSFSVYGVIYTVDFHWNAGDENYSFSIPGGGAITISEIVSLLGIGAEGSENIGTFIENILDVEFSNPEYASVSKAEADTTVGAIKDNLGLECTYSAALTEEDIDAINEQSIKEGDWVLISLKAFDTAESLTITMRNGEEIVIGVTDAHTIGPSDTIDSNNSYILCYEENGVYHVLKTDGTTENFSSTSGFDALSNDYRWTFYYVFTEYDRVDSMDYTYYFIRPVADKSKTIALNEAGENLVQEGTNNIALIPHNGGFVLLGYNHSENKHIELGFENGAFVSYNDTKFNDPDDDPLAIQIYQQDPLQQYTFTVQTANPDMGKVSGRDRNNVNQNNVNEYIARTNNNKSNNNQITANPVSHMSGGQNKWVFDYWDLNGERLQGYGATINANTLPIPYNESVLTAHFKLNPAYNMPDSEKEGTPIEDMSDWLQSLKDKNIPLNGDGTKKTAEVYDYENRIYRVDLTAQSSLTTFDGTIDLGFMIDVSGSMQFPSLLYESNDVPNHTARQISTINNSYWTWGGTRYNWQDWGLDTNKTYYIIADPSGTATVCYLYYDSYQGNSWRLCDASKNRFDYNSNGPFKPDGWTYYESTNYGDSYYSTSASYVIMEAGDRVTAADFQDPETAALLRKMNLNINDPKTRAFYLEKSLNGTIDELNNILDVLAIAKNSGDRPDVKIAWNTFRNFLPNEKPGQLQHSFVSASTGIDLSYDFDTYGGGTSTDAALLDAAGVNRNDIRNRYSDTDRRNWDTNNNVNHTYTHVYSSGFQWENSATKYAVLITDGAPQRSGRSITNRYVTEAAQQLKNRDVELVTVGLGMENVTSGKILLYDIADSLSEEKMFYSASSGDELQDVLLQIVRQIMVDASVQGDVNDTINEAFYPVDKATGKPLTAGTMIKLDGTVTTNSSEPHGTITYDQTTGLYGVEWSNQNFTWDGWQGTVYVKAKEDLLGGNAVKTNSGDAVVTAKSYKTSANSPAIELADTSQNPNYNKTQSLPTPRVNINELSFLHNDTDWTVYLGTEVDPKEQIKSLYDSIRVEEVVTKAEDIDNDGLPEMALYENGDTDNNWYPIAPDSFTDERESEGRGDRNTFYLKDLIKNIAEEGNYEWWDYSAHDLNYDRFLELAMTETQKIDSHGNPVVDDHGQPVMEVTGFNIPYQVYGINDNSYINISLTKEIVTGEEADLINKSPHATTVTGNEVEKYTLNVVYSPDYDVLPKGQGGSSTENFHVGTYGTLYQGHAAGTETSTNTHIINVFAKKLKILKVDQSHNELTAEAIFGLYRKATDEELADDEVEKVPLEGLTGSYVLVDELKTVNGTVTTDQLLPLEEGESYYLVETKAPRGYNLLPEILMITVDMEGHNTWTVVPAVPDDEGSQVKPNPYVLSNWLQEATILITDTSGDTTAYAVRDPAEIIYNHTNDTTDASVVYKIINDSGVELPHTGGPGTRFLVLIGALIAAGAGALLIRRKVLG